LGLEIVDLFTTALALNNGEQARDGSKGGKDGELHSGKVLKWTVDLSRQMWGVFLSASAGLRF
jgi:hypothetical protein